MLRKSAIIRRRHAEAGWYRRRWRWHIHHDESGTTVARKEKTHSRPNMMTSEVLAREWQIQIPFTRQRRASLSRQLYLFNLCRQRACLRSALIEPEPSPMPIMKWGLRSRRYRRSEERARHDVAISFGRQHSARMKKVNRRSARRNETDYWYYGRRFPMARHRL